VVTTPGDENRVLRSAPHMEKSPAVKAGARARCQRLYAADFKGDPAVTPAGKAGARELG
jgi:hypothetical protein